MTKRVLLAEDEPNIVVSLTFLLERAGFEVEVHDNGDDALQAATTSPPDVMVLDVMMPGLDGFEVLRRLRSETSDKTHLPVLILTAKGQSEDRDTALKLGADRFITKPFSNADVVAAVHELAGVSCA